MYLSNLVHAKIFVLFTECVYCMFLDCTLTDALYACCQVVLTQSIDWRRESTRKKNIILGSGNKYDDKKL